MIYLHYRLALSDGILREAELEEDVVDKIEFCSHDQFEDYLYGWEDEHQSKIRDFLKIYRYF